jgi:hypothetical protein
VAGLWPRQDTFKDPGTAPGNAYAICIPDPVPNAQVICKKSWRIGHRSADSRCRGHPAGHGQRDPGRAAGAIEGCRSGPAAGRGRDHAAGERPGESDVERRRLHDRRAQLARHRAINCASSYRGLHEAVINHANNKPKIITCVHEDIAVHLAQGYAKIEGKPIAMACHGVVVNERQPA